MSTHIKIMAVREAGDVACEILAAQFQVVVAPFAGRGQRAHPEVVVGGRMTVQGLPTRSSAEPAAGAWKVSSRLHWPSRTGIGMKRNMASSAVVMSREMTAVAFKAPPPFRHSDNEAQRGEDRADHARHHDVEREPARQLPEEAAVGERIQGRRYAQGLVPFPAVIGRYVRLRIGGRGSAFGLVPRVDHAYSHVTAGRGGKVARDAG